METEKKPITIEDLDARLDRMERLILLGSKEVLNVSEAAIMLDCSESTVRHLLSENKITYHKQGGRTYIAKSDIVKWQTATRVPSNDEIESIAATHAYKARLRWKSQSNDKLNK